MLITGKKKVECSKLEMPQESSSTGINMFYILEDKLLYAWSV